MAPLNAIVHRYQRQGGHDYATQLKILENYVQHVVQYIAQHGKDLIIMLAVNYSTIRNNLKDYCDKVTDENETVIVTRKDEKNVVILSLEHYNALSKRARNAEYLDKIDRSLQELSEGKAISFTMDELEAMETMAKSEIYALVQKRRAQALFGLISTMLL